MALLRRLLSGALSALMTVLLPACDGINLPKLKPGRTTAQEVRQIMGPPTMTWSDADGTQTWEYPRTPQGIVNYMIVIGADQVLREVRQVLSEENFARVKAGMSRDEVRRLLGQPATEVFFALKKEYVWDWRIRNEGATTGYFNVHFDEGWRVTHTSTSFTASN